jgi:hypothetical protein
LHVRAAQTTPAEISHRRLKGNSTRRDFTAHGAAKEIFCMLSVMEQRTNYRDKDLSIPCEL